MTTEHPLSAARDAGVENLFETVFKGYAKRQVEDYIAWLQEQVSAAKAELTDARRELAVAREDLLATRAQLQTRPQHEEISVRMAQILRLAEEEAQQERDQAMQQAAQALEHARGEARSALEAANDKADEIVRNARRECEDELAAARAEANRLVDTARRQAEATMSDARERAQRALADADRRTEQITALQQRRLAAVLAAHEDAMRRLEAVRGVIGEVLVQDREQGDPATSVDPAALPSAGAAVDPASVPLPPRPQQEGAPVPVPPPAPQLVPVPARPSSPTTSAGSPGNGGPHLAGANGQQTHASVQQAQQAPHGQQGQHGQHGQQSRQAQVDRSAPEPGPSGSMAPVLPHRAASPLSQPVSQPVSQLHVRPAAQVSAGGQAAAMTVQVAVHEELPAEQPVALTVVPPMPVSAPDAGSLESAGEADARPEGTDSEGVAASALGSSGGEAVDDGVRDIVVPKPARRAAPRPSRARKASSESADDDTAGAAPSPAAAGGVDGPAGGRDAGGSSTADA
jgi:cell division septum initiation protein DivIVA